METTEKIVEAYCRYIKRWATIPNIKCPGQYEIDLLAVDPVTMERYHLESGISISGAYSKLTGKPFSQTKLRQRAEQAGQRRTLGYFIERKFGAEEVLAVLQNYGFERGRYCKIIVTWGWDQSVEGLAEKEGIILWDFREMLREIEEALQKTRSYFTDDTLRTLQLFSRASAL